MIQHLLHCESTRALLTLPGAEAQPPLQGVKEALSLDLPRWSTNPRLVTACLTSLAMVSVWRGLPAVFAVGGAPVQTSVLRMWDKRSGERSSTVKFLRPERLEPMLP